jgi:hypothetical protein
MRSRLQELALKIESDSEALHFFTLIRTDLESYLPDKYPALRFYCNWMLHSELSDLKDFKRLFLEALNLFDKHLRRELNEKILQVTSFKNLQSELKQYLKEVSIYSTYVEEPKWSELKKYLRTLILGRPLNLKRLGTKLTQFVITDKNYIEISEPCLYWQLWMEMSPYPVSSPIEESLL